MPSPFPGMNPYLERDGVWDDFHHSFIVGARAALVQQLRSDYIVKLRRDSTYSGSGTCRLNAPGIWRSSTVRRENPRPLSSC